MRRISARSIPVPLKAAATVAALTTVALVLVAVLMARIDLTAREYRAAEAAEREYSAIAGKLPGFGDDPELDEIGIAALGELGKLAAEGGQDRLVAVRRSGEAPWPYGLRRLADGFVAFDLKGARYAGVVRPLGDGSAVLVAVPVPSTGPLRAAFWRWGLLIAGVIVVIAALTAAIIGAAITRRIALLNALCEDVERGNVEARHADASGDEIGVLSRHMNRMLDELQRRLEALRDTTDGLAHDLRTPLARVQGRLSRLDDSLDGGPGAGELHLAIQELARLMDSFNALLELREIETEGPVPAQAFSVRKAVEDAIDLYEAVAEDVRDIRIDAVLQPCSAVGSAPLVVRAVANLLDNAIKASPDHGVVDVSLEEDGGNAVIRVRDRGVGLTSEDSKRVSTLGGHGIGLRIVRAVARRHGGRFTLSDGDPGALAELTLPRPFTRQVS